MTLSVPFENVSTGKERERKDRKARKDRQDHKIPWHPFAIFAFFTIFARNLAPPRHPVTRSHAAQVQAPALFVIGPFAYAT
jgi:hypothetical protein